MLTLSGSARSPSGSALTLCSLCAQDLTTLLIVERPADPLPFLADHLDKGDEVKLPSEDGACGTEEKATAYLEEHRLPQVLEELMGKVLYERPDDPRPFLAEQLRLVARGAWAEGKKDGFFADDDLRGMFSLFDPTRKGTISPAQAVAGVKSLGLDGVEPPEGDTLSEDAFVAWARAALDKARIL